MIGALEQRGVEALILKGAALAQTLYAPDRERSYYDVDLLVAPASLDTAATVLSALAYRNITSVQGIDDVAGVVHAELWTRLEAAGNMSIDLHRKLPGCEAPDQTIWRSLREGAQAIRLDGHPVLTLGNPGLALHLALHLAQHGPSDIKAAADLRLGLTRWPEAVWQAAATLARELAAHEAFSAGLRLVAEGEAQAAALDLSSGEQVLLGLAQRGIRPRGTFHVEALTRARTIGERAGILRKALLPAPNWIRWEMAWAARSRLHLASAYLVHLVRTPLWAARALRYARRHRP